MIIDITMPVFSIDLDNRGSYSYNSLDFTNSKIIISEEYPLGFPELKDGEILFRYTENRGYILKNETTIDIEALIKKWSRYGLNEGVDKSKLSLLSYCYEKASLVLTNNMVYTDNNFDTVIFPIIRRIIDKSNIDTTNTINYTEYDKFVSNLIVDYNSYRKDYGKHIEFMLTRIMGNDKIDIEVEIVRLYCEINDFNKILNKK